jgi:hypothetical protein
MVYKAPRLSPVSAQDRNESKRIRLCSSLDNTNRSYSMQKQRPTWARRCSHAAFSSPTRASSRDSGTAASSPTVDTPKPWQQRNTQATATAAAAEVNTQHEQQHRLHVVHHVLLSMPTQHVQQAVMQSKSTGLCCRTKPQKCTSELYCRAVLQGCGAGHTARLYYRNVIYDCTAGLYCRAILLYMTSNCTAWLHCRTVLPGPAPSSACKGRRVKG